MQINTVLAIALVASLLGVDGDSYARGGGGGGGGFHGGGGGGFHGGGGGGARSAGAAHAGGARSSAARSGARSGTARSHSVAGAHAGSHGGYGHGGGYGRGGYGRGWNNGWAGFGWGGWGFGGFWGLGLWYPWIGLGWGWGWGPGLIAGYNYDYAIPQQAIVTVYNNNYPYWGYDLGAGEELDDLARDGQWDDIKHRLVDLRDDYQEQIDTEKAKTQVNKEKVTALEDRVNKIQLHLNGLSKKPDDLEGAGSEQAGTQMPSKANASRDAGMNY